MNPTTQLILSGGTGASVPPLGSASWCAQDHPGFGTKSPPSQEIPQSWADFTKSAGHSAVLSAAECQLPVPLDPQGKGLRVGWAIL